MNESPIWKPRRETRVDAEGICLMHGGPVGMQLPEHEHTELQIETHFTAGIQTDGGRLLDEEPSFSRIIPSGQPHRGRWDDQCEVIVLLLSNDLLERASDELLRVSKCEFVATAYGSDAIIHALSRRLRHRFKSGAASDLLFVESVTHRMVEQLVRRFCVRSGERGLKGSLMPRQLKLIVELIESRLGDRIGVRELASQLGMGPHQFTHHFRAATGESPYQFILRRKIERARTFLIETDMNLSEIAHGMGFVSQSHFTQVFRRITGATPRKFHIATRTSPVRSRPGKSLRPI